MLSFLFMVHRGVLAASELCLGQCGEAQAQIEDEGWDTLNSAFVHAATFALGCVFSNWLNKKRGSWKPGMSMRSLGRSARAEPKADPDATANDDVLDKEAEALVDELSSVANSDEGIVKRNLDETALSLAHIFEAEIALDEEDVMYEPRKKIDHDKDEIGFGKTARGLAQIFKDELSDDEETSAPCSPARSEACSLSPPSPPSPSPVASPLGHVGVSVQLPVAEADLDSLLLLRGLEAALASRTSATTEGRHTCFYGEDVCDMSAFVYIARVHRTFKCSNPCFVIALLYMDQVCERSEDIVVTENTWHRLFLTCIVLALKFHDDEYRPHSNAFYAQIGGLSVSELNEMEGHVCRLLNWKFCVQLPEYDRYSDLIYGTAATF